MSAIQLRRLEAIPARRGFEPAPRLPEMFRAPIDFIAAGHARQLVVCEIMDRLLRNPRPGSS